MSHKIVVSVRVRPLRDEATGASVVRPEPGGVSIAGRRVHGFNSVVVGADQSVAHEAIAAPLLGQLMEGYSCTLLAYGQTGSGKTHTVFGPTGCLTEASVAAAAGGVPADWGLFPRLVLEILAAGIGSLHASAIEVYQERAFDLLADRNPLTVGGKSAGLKVGGSGPAIMCGAGAALASSAPSRRSRVAHEGVHPPGCSCGKCIVAQEKALEALKAKRAEREAAQVAQRASSGRRGSGGGGGGGGAASAAKPEDESFATVGETLVPLANAADVARFARTIEATRQCTSHALNARSSRSHCLVHLHIAERRGGRVAHKQLLVVDLAGSERILKSGVEGTAQDQAITINGSLTALGKVIRALGRREAHVPYRDSTLTMLLRASLGGRARTAVVINVAPDAEHADETACSLEFGTRMAAVRTAATVVVGTDAAGEVANVRAQCEAARARLAQLEREGHGEWWSDDPNHASEIKSIRENMRRQEAEEAAAKRARAELAEAKARAKVAAGGGGRADYGSAVAALAARVEKYEKEGQGVREVLERQLTIERLYRPPKAAYASQAAQVRQLEMQLSMLEPT